MRNLPIDNKLAQKIRIQSARYMLVNGTLYKRGYMLPLLKCLSKDEAAYVLKEIHEGVCGSHSGGRMLAHKAIRVGYYWPKMSKDSSEVVKHYDKCQRFGQSITSTPEALSFISSPWPIAQRGIDLVGPMLTGTGGHKFFVVAVDYFTRWPEAEALATITTRSIRNFFWKSVIYRYGIPHAFVTDNGKQFDCEPFRKWCAELHIRNYFSSLGHVVQIYLTRKCINHLYGLQVRGQTHRELYF